jgi:hypothetical protein
MKFPNYLISSLAIVGAFSLIIMACSADNSNSTSSVNSIGKYQITSGNGSGLQFYVMDTETGIVKSYAKSAGTTGSHILVETITTQP